MPDQAEKLRQMIAAEAPAGATDASGPPLIAVTGGKGGVGTTTVAMNLAAALADLGQRVVLVDAARRHADLTQLAGIHICGGGTLTEVLTGKISALDALAPGPAGTLLLADRWAAKSRADYSQASQQRLLSELASLAVVADVVVVDTGSGASQWIQRFWQHAQVIILPTTCDDVAVMDTYATIKLGSAVAADADLRVLLNRCDSDALSISIERRLAIVCQRFLGRTISALPALPAQRVAGAAELDQSPPRVWEAPDSPFGHATLWLGRAVGDLLERRVREPRSPINA